MSEHEIVTAAHYGGVRELARSLGRRLGISPEARAATAGEVRAEVNHGRWLARCPRCPGAELVQPDDPVMWCLSCGAGPYRVRFPRERRQIEALLLLRPRPEARNWRPGESLDDLRRENEEAM